MSISYAFRLSNLAGQVIVVALFIGSILAWSMMLTKARELSMADRANRRFLRMYLAQRRRDALPHYPEFARGQWCPLYAIYNQACLAAGAPPEPSSDRHARGSESAPARKPASDNLAAVRTAAENAMADQGLLLEKHMGTIATSVTTAPLLGLLGTVWGIMDAFGSIALSGGNTLSAVAPGVAGALLTTVVGLLVAVPSAVGYNLLANKIRRMAVNMENFQNTLLSDIEMRHVAVAGPNNDAGANP